MTVLLCVGRRIDAPDAPIQRFPLARVDAVRQAIRAFLTDHHISAVVASGACGADLLALDEAHHAHIATRMVLPFAKKNFRATSVIDRPGNWGPLFDRVYAATKTSLGIKTLGTKHDAERDYRRANDFILSEAQQIAQQMPRPKLLAVLVWDGAPRGPDDMTAAFADLAAKHQIPVEAILTRAPEPSEVPRP